MACAMCKGHPKGVQTIHNATFTYSPQFGDVHVQVSKYSIKIYGPAWFCAVLSSVPEHYFIGAYIYDWMGPRSVKYLKIMPWGGRATTPK